MLPSKDANISHSIAIRNLHFIPSEIDSQECINMCFLDANKKLLVQQSKHAFVIDLGAGPDEHGSSPHSTLASGQISKEIIVSLIAHVGMQVSIDLVHRVSCGRAIWS